MTGLTLFLQFTSTVLLTDVVLGPVLGHGNTINMAIGLSNQQIVRDTNYFTSTPVQFDAFAEYTENSIVGDGISDTGVTVRGFLPITDQATKSSLRSYNGTAGLFDTRIVCARPEITFSTFNQSVSNLSFRILGGPVTTNIYKLQLQGTADEKLSPNSLFREGEKNATGLAASFDCSYQVNGPAVPFLLCMKDTGAGLVSKLAPDTPADNGRDLILSPGAGRSWLFWDMRDSCGTNDEACNGDSLQVSKGTQDGIWQEYDLNASTDMLGSIRVTMCYDAL